MSRARLAFYKLLGLSAGRANRIEKIRCRRLNQIVLGSGNALNEGCWLWPNDKLSDRPRIVIGNNNYFNRDVMIDACGEVLIGNGNMFGPGVYITDSDHGFEFGGTPASLPMRIGRVKIGDNCWVGAKAVILKDAELGNNCVVAAGAVVTKSFGRGSVIAGVPARLIRVLEPA